MKKWISGIILLIILAVLSTSVLAAFESYIPMVVTETTGESYTQLPVIQDIDNDNLVDNKYIEEDGTDTNVQLTGATQKYMLASDKTLYAIPTVSAYGQYTSTYYLGWDAAQSFSILTGVDGGITVADAVNLELGDSFEIEIKGWIDTSYAANKNLVYKANAIKIYISAEGNIQAIITGGATVTATGVTSNERTIMVKADGINLEIYVDDMVTPKHSQPIGAAVPNTNDVWKLLQNNVMPYVEYIKIRVS